MKEAVVVSAVRTPVGKAPRGMFRTTQPEHLSVTAIRAALEGAPGLDPAEIDDVIMGCAFPEAEQGLNVARNYALLAGLPETVPRRSRRTPSTARQPPSPRAGNA